MYRADSAENHLHRPRGLRGGWAHEHLIMRCRPPSLPSVSVYLAPVVKREVYAASPTLLSAYKLLRKFLNGPQHTKRIDGYVGSAEAVLSPPRSLI